MSYSVDICFICLKNSDSLIFIRSQDTNGLSIEDKLKYLLPELELNSNIPKYICSKCGRNLNKSYEFKQTCLQNITTYEQHAQQVTTADPCYKYLSVVINPDLVCDEAEITEPQTEIEFVNVANGEEVIVKEETSEELVLDDELDSLLHEIKQENSKLDDNTQQNNKITNNGVLDLDELFKCNICRKSLKWPQNLKQHQLIHTNNKPYTCKICNKSFRQRQHLKCHQSIHTGEKPFTCEVCNKTFRLLCQLKRHQLIHSNEPINCEICNKSFTTKQNLRTHSKMHK